MTGAAPVDAVLFDLDDTLCTYRQSGRDLLARAFADVGVDPFFTLEDYHARYPEFVADSDDVRDLRRACFADIAGERGHDPDLGRAVADAYAAERDHSAVDPLPGAREAVSVLSDRYTLGLVTNGGPTMQREKLSAIGLEDAFEAVVYAGYDTAPKPDPEPFEHALDQFGTAASRAVHIGNSLNSDVPGANAAGVRSVWYVNEEVDEPGPGARPDYRVESLAELTTPPWE